VTWSLGLAADFSIPIVTAILVAIAACGASLGMIAMLRRLLAPGLLTARITERSAHGHPARQIGGLGLVPAALVVTLVTVTLIGADAAPLLGPAAGMILLFALGLADDLLDFGPTIKLPVQFIAAGLAATGLDLGTGWLGALPLPLAAILAVLVIVGFVNLVNFMDGLDLMSVAGAGTGILFLGLVFLTSGNIVAALLAASLWGATIGFAWHNRPPAAVFLGDSGSLPLGLAAGYLVLSASGTVPLAAAFLPFGYYLVDGVLTALVRLKSGENIFRAHAQHAYQHARRAGFGVRRIAGEAAVVTTLGGLAALTHQTAPGPLAWALTVTAWIAAAGLTWRFKRVS
tara:strand:+ start:3243 stop:4274 length:1032 start_codon:yes stop_codon:yes gene_type:complete